MGFVKATKIQVSFSRFLDINECTENSDGCAQICTNNAGSFICSCRSGYRLGSNGRNCIGKLYCIIVLYLEPNDNGGHFSFRYQ